MSVCVVAQYPWRAAVPFAEGEPAGVIVCNDTRVTKGKLISSVSLPKQLTLARNLVVCYTSSHLYATRLALDKSFHSQDLRKIGHALRDAHKTWGGTTELLGVVSRKSQAPRILELMAPKYVPKPRVGIVGIGDSGALDWFRNNFQPIYGPPPTPAAAIESLQRIVGRPLEAHRFRIIDAGRDIAAALDQAIRKGGGHTVGLPIQVLTLAAGSIRRLVVARGSPDGSVWTTITADQSALRWLNLSPQKARMDRLHHTASQLFP